MGKNRKQASLTNVVQYDSNFNLSIGSSTSSSFNSSGSIIAASGFTGSLSGSVFGLGDTVSFSSSVLSQLNTLQVTSGSNIGRLNNLESKSSSVDTSISNINTFTSSNANTSLNQLTGSLATTGSNTFYGTQTFSGSVYVANNLIVQGSSSIQYISASSVSIGTNIVQLNTATPSVRFAGLTMIDSGSVGGSGSFLYDSVQDEFIFVHRGNGTNVTSSHFVTGPETYDNLGNEIYLTCNTIPKGTGKEHLVDSSIFDNGTTVCVNSTLKASGQICSLMGNFSCVGIGMESPQSSLHIIKALGNDVINIGESGTSTRFAIGQEASYTGNYINSRNIDLKLQAYCAGGSGGNIHFQTGTSGTSCVTTKMFICSNGSVGIGATSPAARLHICTTYGANNIQGIFGNSNGSINFQPYDTVIIQQDDVTTLKLVERNIGSIDQVLTMTIGDSSSRISTTCANPLQFFVGGNPSGCGYNGLSGRNAISIACSGITSFNYPVYMGNISQYNNYSNLSGCFAIFCASQGATLFATSMHNNGRASYQLIYSNGPTGGASISVVGSTGAYGPAATAFGLCANGWVYAYQQYGGPTDYYAINMNGSFSWAF